VSAGDRVDSGYNKAKVLFMMENAIQISFTGSDGETEKDLHVHCSCTEGSHAP